MNLAYSHRLQLKFLRLIMFGCFLCSFPTTQEPTKVVTVSLETALVETQLVESALVESSLVQTYFH